MSTVVSRCLDHGALAKRGRILGLGRLLSSTASEEPAAACVRRARIAWLKLIFCDEGICL